MATSDESSRCYWKTITLRHGDTGEEIEVALAQADIDKATSDPFFANAIFLRHKAVMAGTVNQHAVPLARVSLATTTTTVKDRQTEVHASMSSVENLQGDHPLVQWTPAATLLLISSWSEHKQQRESAIVKATEVWSMIARDLHQAGNPYTKEQCSNKWRALKQHYTKILDMSKKTGRGKVGSWNYFAAMQEALAGDPAVVPLLLLDSSRGVSTASSTSNSTLCISTPSTSSTSLSTPISPSPPPKRLSKKRKTEWQFMYDSMKEDRRERDENRMKMHDERMVQMTRTNDLLERLLGSKEK